MLCFIEFSFNSHPVFLHFRSWLILWSSIFSLQKSCAGLGWSKSRWQSPLLWHPWEFLTTWNIMKYGTKIRKLPTALCFNASQRGSFFPNNLDHLQRLNSLHKWWYISYALHSGNHESSGHNEWLLGLIFFVSPMWHSKWPAAKNLTWMYMISLLNKRNSQPVKLHQRISLAATFFLVACPSLLVFSHVVACLNPIFLVWRCQHQFFGGSMFHVCYFKWFFLLKLCQNLFFFGWFNP